MQARRKATRSDVAQLAGVSQATVSLVLNGQAEQVRLSAETCERVRQAARQLNYVPNATARALADRRTRTIGVVAQWTEGHNHSAFQNFAVAAIERAAAHRHFVTFLSTVKVGAVEDYDFLREAQVDGVIVYGEEAMRRVGPSLAAWGIPLVGLDIAGGHTGDSGATIITADYRQGGMLLAAHLRERGHERVAMIYGASQTAAEIGARFAGFVAAWGDPQSIAQAQTPNWSPDAGYRAMRELLARDAGFTAVFAGNDLLAGGAMHAAREAGLRIPTDLAIVGFGDLLMSAHLTPPLTTIRVPLGDLGARAIDRLIGQLNKELPPGGEEVFPVELVVRAST